MPCFNRPGDLKALLGDLEALELRSTRGEIDLRVIVVDNASTPPLSLLDLAPTPTPTPTPTTNQVGTSADRILLLRLPTNTGGSGGFNAGLSAWLDLEPALNEAQQNLSESYDFLWLVDSDARLRPDTLRLLVDSLAADSSMVAVGPAVADPADWKVHEVGGMIDDSDGFMKPLYVSLEDCPSTQPLVCDYVAACCALVRRDAVERVGLLPDRFLNADDSEWFIRIARDTGGRVCVLPSCVAAHPRFDRYPTWARFYCTRNMMGPVKARGLGHRVRLRRVMSEVGRAINMTMMGRDDLAALHLSGLREAAARRTLGPSALASSPLLSMRLAREFAATVAAARVASASGASPLPVWVHPRISSQPIEYAWVLAQLKAAGIDAIVGLDPEKLAPGVLFRQLARMFAAVWRAFVMPPARLAIVPASGKPGAWLTGRTTISVTHDAFIVHNPRSLERLWESFAMGVRSLVPALKIGLQPMTPDALPRRVARLGEFVAAHDPSTTNSSALSRSTSDSTAVAPRPPARLSVVIVSYNRRDSLRTTLGHVRADATTANAEILVVDNASTDGSPAMVGAEFPSVRLIQLQTNIAVAGFNVGVATARGPIVLVLDDDARPDAESLSQALSALELNLSLAAIPLHPRHPATGASEWPFATGPRAATIAAASRWPIMGCGNLVRRDDWLAVGGYDETFFLYRNDVDLAMKLLAAGRGVTIDPAWVVWHDSPAAARKSARWFELATRNWFWLARRHASGPASWLGVLIGWAWAHRLAGLQPVMHLRILRGLLRSLSRPPPQVQPCVRNGPGKRGRAYAEYLTLQLWGRRGGEITGSPMVQPSLTSALVGASTDSVIGVSPDVSTDAPVRPTASAGEPPLVVVPRGIASNTIASSSRHSP